jgi:hypothetical protein
MAALRVVPSLDEIEHCHPRLVGLEALPVEEFAFEGGEETLAHGVCRNSRPPTPSERGGNFVLASHTMRPYEAKEEKYGNQAGGTSLG